MSSAMKEIIVQSGSLPLYLRTFRINVHYCAGMFPDIERQDTIEEAFAELQDAFQLGFFCWDYFPTRETAKVTLEWNADSHMTVDVVGNGLHYNALVATVRLVVNLHHTNLETYESLKSLLRDDIDALPKPKAFRETVASLVISEMDRADQRMVVTPDVLTYAEEGIIFPAYAPLQGAMNEDFMDNGGVKLDRLIITSPVDKLLPSQDLEKIEDYFLRLVDSGVFTSMDKLDQQIRDNEAEIFERKCGDEIQLLLGDYHEQKYGVVEFLNVISGGDINRLVISDESDG